MIGANPVLVEVVRGPLVESRHRGSAVVIDSDGCRRAQWGDTDASVFPRSAVKPLQALPLVESGAAQAYAIDDIELALACASHGGEEAHVEKVEQWLGRLGLTAADLVCGPHPPLVEAAALALVRAGAAPARLHNNCSGKHAGFLTLARHLGVPVAGYGEPWHPVQQAVAATLAELGDFDADKAPLGIDGCGVPTVGLPLSALALCFARLTASGMQPAPRATAIRRILQAMTAQPWFVGGTGRFDTLVMSAAAGGVIVKSGAEGVAAAAVLQGGFGLAVKIDDGGKRGCDVAMAALLQRFAGPGAALQTLLTQFATAPVRNTAGHIVGTLRPAAGWLD